MDHKYSDPRPTAVTDTECYQNYWSIGFKDIETGRKIVIEKYDGLALDTARIAKIFRNWRLVTFNGYKYDMPMIALAMSGATNAELKRASDDIILTELQPWQFYERYDVALPSFIDYIDVMEVSPGSPTHPSLKLYAGRLHSRQMMDLPFTPDAWINEADRPTMVEYLGIDLDDTHDLYNELKPQIELRAEMSDQYGVDVRSKSDAQIAEAIIKVEIERLTKKKVYRPKVEPGTFNYVPPAWVNFKTASMQGIFERICEAKFTVRGDGVVEAPESLTKILKEFFIGEMSYKAGIGGLHSQEKKTSHFSDDEFVLIDRDVTSYYPTIILNAGMYPKHLGEVFLKVYRSIYERRLKAKKNSQQKNADPKYVRRMKDIAETLKILLNGTFGKLGSAYSILYSPKFLIQVTLNGQLALLMLIERLEMIGMRVVSANTDGFITKVPRARYAECLDLVMEWELATGFSTEKTEYKSLHSRDVNTYVGFPAVGPHKGKGGFGESGPGHKGAFGMKKNPDIDVCYEAVIAHISKGTNIEEFIYTCSNVKKFLTVVRVNGGAETEDGEYIGKAIRWYYSMEMRGQVIKRADGNTVGSSDGAKPCMTMVEEVPLDLDYDRYVREAYAILQDIGMEAADPALRWRTGVTVARPPDQKTYHIVKLPSGVAHCNKELKSIRDSWFEVADVPTGERLCKACVKAAAAFKKDDDL